jgi:hypothetical protein
MTRGQMRVGHAALAGALTGNFDEHHAILGEAAAAATRTGTFPGERYRRIVRRRGKLKALVAIARTILVIIWHLLASRTDKARKPATTSGNSKRWGSPSPSPRPPDLPSARTQISHYQQVRCRPPQAEAGCDFPVKRLLALGAGQAKSLTVI